MEVSDVRYGRKFLKRKESVKILMWGSAFSAKGRIAYLVETAMNLIEVECSMCMCAGDDNRKYTVRTVAYE